MRPRAWEVGAFALALAVSGLVALALLWSGEAAYVDIARASGRESVEFRRIDGGGPIRVELVSLVRFHDGWVAYVTGRTAQQPAESAPWFTDDERRHMADVRGVFIGAEIAATLAAGVLGWLAVRSARGGSLTRLVREGSITALLGVTAVGLLAALAFDALFLAFHQVFFPQGNFQFPPGSNLLALYPESYWYGITLRIGISFVAIAVGLALASSYSGPRPRGPTLAASSAR